MACEGSVPLGSLNSGRGQDDGGDVKYGGVMVEVEQSQCAVQRKEGRCQDERAGGISLDNYKVQSVDVGMAQLRVGVDQLKDNMCTADELLSQDENIVEGQTSGGQYVCTVCTVEPRMCKCVDCAGCDAICEQAANQ